ncbi:ABC transporter permease [Persicobacter psychrovividus]|uniref:Transport permease protein n=1 Tax=Persicobacter psychrovividus TaxID=387638 RepID=A0ABN6LDM9_9BACT|nr:transport permease protein [Persicobacter psychrovividus]
MKQLFIFIKKEFYHAFRDKKTLLMLFGLPIVQILLFGFALTNEIKSSKIVIFDQAKGTYSRQLVERIRISKQFAIKENLQHNTQMLEAFRAGDVKMAIVIPPKFGEQLGRGEQSAIQVITDGTDPNTATNIQSYIENIVSLFLAEKHLLNPQLQIIPEVRMLYNPELKGTTNFVPGVMALVLMLVCVLMTSVSIVREKEMGTMEILLVSPMNPFMVIIAKAIPYFLVSIVNLIIILLLSVFLLGMPFNGSVLLLLAESCLLIFTALSLGLMISNVTNSQQAAMLISLMGLLMPTMMFTGFMFPLENMPVALQVVANFVPAKWYYIIVKSIMIKGLGFSAIWKETLILAVMCVVLLVISIKKFKIRL